jgi:NAD-dependent deacetylase
MEEAMIHTLQADILLVVGTSLAVYPAAGLVNYVGADIPVYVIDPGSPAITARQNVHFIREKATTGMQQWVSEYLSQQ